MREKIAFVCQRYGLEVNGGAELHCRLLAEQMQKIYDVEVYTTCALDYITWANWYPEGTEEINGVVVRRFPTVRERDVKSFGLISDKVFSEKKHSNWDEKIYLWEQGPCIPSGLKTLKANQKKYKAIFFMTYLYYHTAMGMKMNLKNAYLIPTLHDEPPAYLRCFDAVFYNAKGIAWNTQEEKDFAEKRFPGISAKHSDIVALGIEQAPKPWPELPEELQGVDYITYVGRIDPNKGCKEMFEFFLRYKEEFGGNLKLVTAGKPVMEVPDHPDIIQLGFVSDEMKFTVMENAKALLLCSRFESLSMVVLESMSVGRPILVSGHCEVLKGHCIRSNAGLWFDNYTEFAATLNYLLEHEEEYEVMRENGRAYVKENYQWDVIINKICRLIDGKQE